MSITRQEIERAFRRELNLHWDHLGATSTGLQGLKVDFKLDPEHDAVRRVKLILEFDDGVPSDTTQYTFSS